MTIINAKIVLLNNVIELGYVSFKDGIITAIGEGEYKGNDEVIDAQNKILMPGFIDIHFHGSKGIDFMDANVEDYQTIANSLFSEGVTTFLATTLTSDKESLMKVCRNVAAAKKNVPSLGGIHFEGPYINVKYKGAQNEKFIRKPDMNEFEELYKISENNIRYISLAPEYDNAREFIKYVTSLDVTVSAGHTDASFDDVRKAIDVGLTNTTHTYNAMSPHNHRHPGVVSAALYFENLYTEFICDRIHVCDDTLRLSYKIIGPERFIVITDALKIKHSDIDNFELFGLPCICNNGAAYLKDGTLAGSLLTMDQGLRNMNELCVCSLSDLSKICSKNAAKSLHFNDRGEIKVGYLADFVLLDDSLHVQGTYKLGKKVF